MRRPNSALLPCLILAGCGAHRTAAAREAETVRIASGVESVSAGPVESDRGDSPLSRLAELLNTKLRVLAKEGSLRGVPATFRLKLTLNAAGNVAEAEFDRPCGTAGEALKARILAWHFEAWSAPGLTRLQVPVRIVFS